MDVFRFAGSIAAASLAFPLPGQTSLVTDSSAASNCGANSEVRNSRTNALRVAESHANGGFRIEALDPGNDEKAAKMTGFSTFGKRGAPGRCSLRLTV